MAQFGQIADFVLHRKVEEFPQSALNWAALLMLDTAGIAAAATPMDAARIARETALALYGTSDPAFQAKMMFDGRAASIAGAGYAGATGIDNLDGHDGYNPVKGHIGVAVLPTLAVLMQHAPDLSGPEALAAVAVGYEVAGRAGLSLHGTVSDYHTSGAWNALGVVALAARIRGMSRDQLRQALGIAEYHGPRSQMMREIANPTMLHDGSGMGTMVGLSAVVLAEKGFTGAPAITVEEERVSEYWNDLGSNWQIEQQYIKPYPICRWAHGSIDAVREAITKHRVDPESIAHIEVRTFHEAACLYQEMPATTSQAQYSLRFALASYLAQGQVGVAQISGDGLRDPGVKLLMDRIDIVEDARHQARFPSGRWADAVLTLRDGRKVLSGDVNARGGPDTPFSEAQVCEKFEDFANPVLGNTRADRLRDLLLGLRDPGSRLGELIGPIHDPL